MNYQREFDISLKDGKIAESILESILRGSTIEVKTEINQWRDTGNCVIEFESRGKPSGIEVTTAEWWATVLQTGRPPAKVTIHRIILTPTETIKKLVDTERAKGNWVRGGDLNSSKCVLIPLSELINL